MTILTSEIDNDSISLSTFETIGGLVLLWGSSFENEYTVVVNDTTVTVTNTDLGLDSLNNIYFKATVDNQSDPTDTASVGLYEYCVDHSGSSQLYNASNLKQDLDNLNYYTWIIQDLTEKEEFLGANEMFNNFTTTLENIYGNNFLDSVGGSDNVRSCSD